MIMKTVGKLIALWLAMMGILAMSALAVLVFVAIIRYWVVFLIALVFLCLFYALIWFLGIDVSTEPRYGLDDREGEGHENPQTI